MTRFPALFLSFLMCALAVFASDSDKEKPFQTLELSQADMAGFVQMLSCHTKSSEATINQLAGATQPGYMASFIDVGTHVMAGLLGYNYCNIIVNYCSAAYDLSWWSAFLAGASIIIYKVVLPGMESYFQGGHRLGIRQFMNKANMLRVNGKKVIEIKKRGPDLYKIKIFSVDLERIEFKTITFNKKDKEL